MASFIIWILLLEFTDNTTGISNINNKIEWYENNIFHLNKAKSM